MVVKNYGNKSIIVTASGFADTGEKEDYNRVYYIQVSEKWLPKT